MRTAESLFATGDERMPEQDPWVRETIKRYAEKEGLALTAAATELIALPIEEANERNEAPFDRAEITATIIVLMRSMAEAMPADFKKTPVRTAQDVVRAFFEKFCNIPPICDRKGRTV
jgi:hypothetical protein